MKRLTCSLVPKLLLLQLLTTAPSAAEYRTVIANVAIHSPISLVTDVGNECECKTKCWSDSGCTAASYDAVADICSMTDGGPDTVTTRPLLDSVAFFKYDFSETPLEVFLATKTSNASVETQRELCAAAKGVPLIIKTEKTKADAMRITKQGGQLRPITGPKQAWISVRHCQDDPESKCRWPDGTRLIDAVFTDQDVSVSFVNGPATIFRESGELVAYIEFTSAQDYPVLCSKNFD